MICISKLNSLQNSLNFSLHHSDKPWCVSFTLNNKICCFSIPTRIIEGQHNWSFLFQNLYKALLNNTSVLLSDLIIKVWVALDTKTLKTVWFGLKTLLDSNNTPGIFWFYVSVKHSVSCF